MASGSLHCVGEKHSRVFAGLLSGVQSEALESLSGLEWLNCHFKGLC